MLIPLLSAAIACTSASPPPAPAPPPDLSIASVHVAGTPEGNTWTAQNPIPLTLGCTSNPLLVGISPAPDQNSSIGGYQIAVPGGCSNTESCGWFVLRMDPGTDDEIGIPTWTTPITVDAGLEPGTHTLLIELHDAYDRIVLQSDGTPYGEQLSLDFVAAESCPSVESDAG